MSENHNRRCGPEMAADRELTASLMRMHRLFINLSEAQASAGLRATVRLFEIARADQFNSPES